MVTIRFIAGMLVGGSTLFVAVGTSAQNFPTKPIRLFASIGGGGDFAARVIAQGLTTGVGQQVIVENRGGGVIAGELVAKAPPDGYTLLYYGNTLWLLPLMRDFVPYDPLKDFAPVTLTLRTTNVLAVHPLLPAKSVRELIALGRSRSGELNYGSGAAGSAGHLAAELLKSMAGINIVRIAYKGTGPALNAVISGEIQMLFSTPGTVMPHVKTRRLRALAVTSAQPSALAPDLPTMASSGLPGYETGGAYGMFAPAGTSLALINYLHKQIVDVINKPDVKGTFYSSGAEVVGGSPEQLAAAMRSEITMLGKVIKDAGIRD